MVVFAIGIMVIVIQRNLICNHLIISGLGYQDSATSVSFHDMLFARSGVIVIAANNLSILACARSANWTFERGSPSA